MVMVEVKDATIIYIQRLDMEKNPLLAPAFQILFKYILHRGDGIGECVSLLSQLCMCRSAVVSNLFIETKRWVQGGFLVLVPSDLRSPRRMHFYINGTH